MGVPPKQFHRGAWSEKDADGYSIYCVCGFNKKTRYRYEAIEALFKHFKKARTFNTDVKTWAYTKKQKRIY